MERHECVCVHGEPLTVLSDSSELFLVSPGCCWGTNLRRGGDTLVFLIDFSSSFLSPLSSVCPAGHMSVHVYPPNLALTTSL